MSIIKRGGIDSSLVIVSFSFICNKCGYELITEKELNNNSCKKCSEGIMKFVGVTTVSTKEAKK